MEKGEREVRERKGKGGRRGEGEKGEMGVDPTKFGKKSMPVFIRLYYFVYKNNRPIASRLQRAKLPTSFKIDKLSLLRPK